MFIVETCSDESNLLDIIMLCSSSLKFRTPEIDRKLLTHLLLFNSCYSLGSPSTGVVKITSVEIESGLV